MHLPLLTALTSLLTLTTALPTSPPSPLSTFYLVTSDQSIPTKNSSQLRGVHATTPYAEDPISQSTLLLRLIGPGYASLPNFTLTSGVLSTLTSGPHGIGNVQYNSSTVAAGQELQFLAKAQEGGNVGFREDGLITVDGEGEGWTICDSSSGTDVLWWRGKGKDCKGTFLWGVERVPYRK